MQNLRTFGVESVEFSITNPVYVAKGEVKDNFQPFSFFDFLKYTNSENNVDVYENEYLHYLKIWYQTKGTTESVTNSSILERYVELLKNITLNYTTTEEKRFLSNIDFNDPSDLEIAIPFYSNRLKEISIFLRNQRQQLKYNIQQASIKGTNYGVEKVIANYIFNYVFTNDKDTISTTTYPLSTIVDQLDIEVEEFVDTYSSYFNINPDPGNQPGDRLEYYTSNYNGISASTFLLSAVTSDVIKNIFLNELKNNFTINVPISLNCGSPANICVNSENELNVLRRKLIQKFIGVDYYYLSTNSTTQYLSGVLFRADNPSGNYINIKNASTATIPSEQLLSLRKVGLFFTPDKTGVLKFNTKNKTYYIDETKLEANKTYVFPDPEVYGNIEYKTEVPIIYEVDNTSDIVGISNTLCYGNPKVETLDQAQFAYFSTQQLHDSQKINEDGLTVNFVSLYNQGFLNDYKVDIYGNQYGLFKSQYGIFFNQPPTHEISELYIKDLLLDGHNFFNENVGYTQPASAFNIYTNNFIYSANPYYFNFRFFNQYQDLIEDSIVTKIWELDDCGPLTFNDGTALPYSISSDLSSYQIAYDNKSLSVYYNILVDGGLNANFTRAIISTNSSLTGTFLSNPNFALSAGLAIWDGGLFTDNIVIDTNTYNYSPSIPYINAAVPGNTTQYSSLTSYGTQDIDTIANRTNLGGQLFVKNVLSGSAYTLSSTNALYNTFSKYTSSVKAEIFGSNINYFNVYYDVIAIKTPNYLVIDKINYDGSFTTPQTINTYFTISGDYTHVTNFFVKDNVIYYAILSASNPNSTYRSIIPYIYTYNIKTNKNTLVYPTINSSDTFTLSSLLSTVNITNINSAKLAYNSRNDLFVITYIAEDQNNSPYIIDYKFAYKQDRPLEFKSSQVFYNQSSFINSTNFYMISTLPGNILYQNKQGSSYTIFNTNGIMQF